MNIAEKQFGTGVIPEKPSSKSLFYEEISGGIAEPFDWAEGFNLEAVIGGEIIRKSQGKSLSCVGQSVSQLTWAYQVLEMKKFTGMTLPELKKHQPNTVADHSAKSIYSQIALPSGGAYVSSALKLVTKYGVQLENLVPSYIDGADPDERFMKSEVWKQEVMSYLAENLKGKKFAWLSNNNIDTVAKAIKENNGVILVLGGENNGTWRNKIPKPPKEKADWYHAIYCYGAVMIMGEKFILTRNSWDLGFVQFISEEYFKSGHVGTAFTLVDDVSLTKLTLYKPESLEGGAIKREVIKHEGDWINGFIKNGWGFEKIEHAREG